MQSFPQPSVFGSFLSKVQYYGVVYILIPGITIFQMTVVYPNLVAALHAGILKQIFHVCLISFFLLNVIGNLIFSMMMDSTLKKPGYGKGSYCDSCQMSRPVKSWHCKICNVCIVRRDHHCTFLARCIGMYNQRYFILFLGYVFLSMSYATYYNYYFVSLKYKDEGWALSICRIINPLLRFVVPEPMGAKEMFVFYLFMNIFLIVWSGCLFYYHLRNVVMGVTAYESKFPELMNSLRWKQNLLNVFGTRWYLAVLCPLCESRLPAPQDDDS